MEFSLVLLINYFISLIQAKINQCPVNPNQNDVIANVYYDQNTKKSFEIILSKMSTFRLYNNKIYSHKGDCCRDNTDPFKKGESYKIYEEDYILNDFFQNKNCYQSNQFFTEQLSIKDLKSFLNEYNDSNFFIDMPNTSINDSNLSSSGQQYIFLHPKFYDMDGILKALNYFNQKGDKNLNLQIECIKFLKYKFQYNDIQNINIQIKIKKNSQKLLSFYKAKYRRQNLRFNTNYFIDIIHQLLDFIKQEVDFEGNKYNIMVDEDNKLYFFYMNDDRVMFPMKQVTENLVSVFIFNINNQVFAFEKFVSKNFYYLLQTIVQKQKKNQQASDRILNNLLMLLKNENPFQNFIRNLQDFIIKNSFYLEETDKINPSLLHYKNSIVIKNKIERLKNFQSLNEPYMIQKIFYPLTLQKENQKYSDQKEPLLLINPKDIEQKLLQKLIQKNSFQKLFFTTLILIINF